MKRKLALALVATIVALNFVAYRHAYRMTHFVVAGTKTKSPRQLSIAGKIVTLIRGVEIPKPETGKLDVPARTVYFVAADGVRLEAWDIPATNEAGIALMFPGYAVSRSALTGEARLLRELGWRTVLVDFRGAGGSDGFVTTLGWHEAKDVAATVDWARREWPGSRLLLYGQSMGAAAVLRSIAMENVRPDAIIVECPFDTLVHTVSHRYHVMGLPAWPFAQLLVLWGGVQHGFNAFAHNPAVYARSVTCPALVLDGEHDPWVMTAEARRVAAAMQGPTECRIFASGGHGGYWWEVGDEYRQVLSTWLNQKNGTGK